MFRKAGCECQSRCSTIRWSRMRSKCTSNKSGFLLVRSFQFLKHRGHCAWVVTRRIHVLDTKFIGFFFSTATELHENTEQPDTGCILVNHSWDTAKENRAADRRILQQRSFCLIFNSMSGSHVCNFVGHHTGQLGLVVSSQQKPFVYVEKASRQSKSIHFIGINDL